LSKPVLPVHFRLFVVTSQLIFCGTAEGEEGKTNAQKPKQNKTRKKRNLLRLTAE
jgi:hypothetical protein